MSACGFYLSDVPSTISLQTVLIQILMLSISLLCDRILLLHTAALSSSLHPIQLAFNIQPIHSENCCVKEDLWQTTK